MEEDDSFLEEATPEALINSVKLAGAFDKLREVLAKELENSGVAAILRERTKEFLMEGGRIATTAARVGGPGKNPTHAAIRTDLLKQVEREKIPEQLQQDLGKALENIHEQMKESIAQALNRCKEEWRRREASETMGESLTVSATMTNDPPPPPSISTKKEVPATKTQDTLARTKSIQPGAKPGLTQRKSATAAANVQPKNPPSVSSVSAQSSRSRPTVGAAPTSSKPPAHDVGKSNKENATARPAPAHAPLPEKIKEERGEEEEKSRQKEIPTPTQPSSAVALPRGQPAAGANRRPKKKISSSDSSDSSSSDDSLSDSELSSMSDSSDSLSDSGSLSDSDSRDSSSEKKTTKGKGTATKGGRGTKRKQDQSSSRKGSSRGTKENSKSTSNGGRAQGQTKKRKLAEVSHIKAEKDAAAEPAASKRRRSEKVEKSGGALSRTKRQKNGIHAGGLEEEEKEEKDRKDGTSHCKKPKERSNGEDKEGDIVNKQNGGYGEGTHGLIDNGEASGDTGEENKFNNGDHLTDSGRRKLRSSLSSRRKRRKVSEVNGSETPTSATESPTTNE